MILLLVSILAIIIENSLGLDSKLMIFLLPSLAMAQKRDWINRILFTVIAYLIFASHSSNYFYYGIILIMYLLLLELIRVNFQQNSMEFMLKFVLQLACYVVLIKLNIKTTYLIAHAIGFIILDYVYSKAWRI